MTQGLLFRNRKQLGATGPVATQDDLRRRLTTHLSGLVDAWFPRTLDTEHGGFLCDFDRDWRSDGPHQKRLEYQARQTRAAAQAAIFDPRFVAARQAAEHGFRYLAETMWDEQYGGWFYLLHRHGEPVYPEKHMHGVAYGIQACAEHHRLTGSAESRALAMKAFDWLDTHAHDSANGGYHTFLMQDGTPITGRPSPGMAPNPLRTPIGMRDFNTTSDLLDALTDLYQATRDTRVGMRLNEQFLILRDKAFQPPGVCYEDYTADWKPASDLVETGLVLQAACALLKAAQVLAEPLRVEASDVADAMLRACLRHMWDSNDGGFYYRARVNGSRITIPDRKKIWWVQAEGLRALLHLAFDKSSKHAADYVAPSYELWTYIEQNFIDLRDKSWWLAPLLSRNPKAYQWKDVSHEMRALVQGIRLLGDQREASRVVG